MQTRPKHHELALNVNWLCKANQKKEALAAINKFFQNVPYDLEWDDFYNQIMNHAFQLSVDCLTAIPQVIITSINLSLDYNEDILSDILMNYIQECRLKIGEEEKHVGDLKKNLVISIPNEILHSIYVTPSINFIFNVISFLLGKLKALTRYDVLFHKIINRGFQLAVEFENAQFFDFLSLEIGVYSSNLEHPTYTKLHSYESIINNVDSSIELEVYSKGYNSLKELSKLLTSNTSPIIYHEQLETKKCVILELLEQRSLFAIQLQWLIEFYQKSPLPPPMPIQHLYDLSIMNAVAYSPIQQKPPNNIDQFLGQKIPQRQDLLQNLLKNAHPSTLKTFVEAAENHEDPFLIHASFKSFLAQYTEEFYTANLFDQLCLYAAIRLIQSLKSIGCCFTMLNLHKIIPWYPEENIESVIIQGVKDQIFNARIDHKNNCVYLL